MAATTSISWADKSWNPLRGCTIKSVGCQHCYAMGQAGRFSGPGQPYKGLVRKTNQGFKWTGEIRLIEKDLDVPLRWRKPKRIFVNSMSDLFHENVSDAWIDKIFAIMALASRHTFQVLTKRAERMQVYTSDSVTPFRIAEAISVLTDTKITSIAWPLSQVWAGVSVENQATLNRLNHLCETPAAVRFASFEPLLENLGDVTPWLQPVLNAAGLDWAIIGGESGPGARPCDLEWIRSLVRQCREVGTATWVKQLGTRPYIVSEFDKTYPVRLAARKGDAPSEWPRDMRIQEFP